MLIHLYLYFPKSALCNIYSFHYSSSFISFLSFTIATCLFFICPHYLCSSNLCMNFLADSYWSSQIPCLIMVQSYSISIAYPISSSTIIFFLMFSYCRVPLSIFPSYSFTEYIFFVCCKSGPRDYLSFSYSSCSCLKLTRTVVPALNSEKKSS